ncbi:ribonuclease J [Candidatus Gracilibacteria bacterium]|nr:ribonuclease J [Candidatus Gracilibacteria bacterium]
MNNLDDWLNKAFGEQTSPNQPRPNSPKPARPVPPRTGQRPAQRPAPQGRGFTSDGRPRRPAPRPTSGAPKPPAARPSAPRPPVARPPQSRPAAARPAAGTRPKRDNFRPSAPKIRTVTKPARKSTGPALIHKGKLRIIPIGGLNEVGKNMTVFEYEDDIIIVDIGIEFPSEDMLGIDYVIPDVSYLEDKLDRIRGIILTHGHLDHIGAIPYIFPKLNFPPTYGLKLTIGMVEARIEEFKQNKLAKLHTIGTDDILKLGKFTCKFVRVTHSIPDCMAVLIETPEGKVFHTADFKFDDTPARNIQLAEIDKLEQLAKQDITVMLSESTNALKPGHSMSEKAVGEELDEIVRDTPGRLLIASFSSQIGRLQQILDAARKHGRNVFVSGRSMDQNIRIANKLGYIHMPPDFIKDIKLYKGSNSPDDRTLILTTGSQGESISALSRMANNEHPHLKITEGDTIILSSSPIPGNEKSINTVINKLTMLGAEVIHNQIKDVHTSGHGCQDELERMINYVRPRYLAPIHGEYYMRKGLVKLATERCQFPLSHAIMLQNGGIIEIEKGVARQAQDTVEAKYILIDGTGEGSMDSSVMSDREILSQNGALIVLLYTDKRTRKLVRRTEVVSRGFIYMEESAEIIRQVIQTADIAYAKILAKNSRGDRQDFKRYVRESIDSFAHKELQRRPLIIPLIIEV